MVRMNKTPLVLMRDYVLAPIMLTLLSLSINYYFSLNPNFIDDFLWYSGKHFFIFFPIMIIGFIISVNRRSVPIAFFTSLFATFYISFCSFAITVHMLIAMVLMTWAACQYFEDRHGLKRYSGAKIFFLIYAVAAIMMFLKIYFY